MHALFCVVADGLYAPDQWRDLAVYATLVDEPDLKVALIRRNTCSGALSMIECHLVLARPSGDEYYVEHHVLGLLTVRAYYAAFEPAGLVLTRQPEGTEERGRYIGARPKWHAGNFGMVHTGEQDGQRVRLGVVCTRRASERHDDGCARALNFTNRCNSQG